MAVVAVIPPPCWAVVEVNTCVRGSDWSVFHTVLVETDTWAWAHKETAVIAVSDRMMFFIRYFLGVLL
jgi:hypothetical protein